MEFHPRKLGALHLLKTGIKIDLTHDENMYNMMEGMKRGTCVM